jgi:hypothetical protein
MPMDTWYIAKADSLLRQQEVFQRTTDRTSRQQEFTTPEAPRLPHRTALSRMAVDAKPFRACPECGAEGAGPIVYGTSGGDACEPRSRLARRFGLEGCAPFAIAQPSPGASRSHAQHAGDCCERRQCAL